MIEVVTNDKWRKPIGEYLKKACHISADIADEYSYIGFVEDDKILGGFLFTDYDGNNIYVHLGFKQIGCNRMTAVCRNGYKRNERILSGTGWTKEGVVRQVMKIDNNFVDAAIYGMLKQECKWI